MLRQDQALGAKTPHGASGPVSAMDASTETAVDPPRARPRSRVLRRAGFCLVGLALAASVAFGLLLALTPSARDAMARVHAQALQHGTIYPPPHPPRRFTQALIATEDHRFYSPVDPGLDPFAVARVIWGTLQLKHDQGGSTIEQQLAKLLYTPGRHGFPITVEQVAIGIKMSFAYTKAEILAMYAEVVYFGSGYWGLERASCGYFGKPAAKLSWAQAAMLAGAVNAPSHDDPRRHPHAARVREAHVFSRLVAVGVLTAAQAKAALAQPLGVIPAEAREGQASCH